MGVHGEHKWRRHAVWACAAWACTAWARTVSVGKMQHFFSGKKLIYYPFLEEKTPSDSYYMSLNNFLQIKRCRLIEN
jgi:hypothetical protein